MGSTLAFILALAASAATAAPEDPCGRLAFRDVAREAGVVFQHDRGARGAKHLPETMGAGMAWLDYDRDGHLDLYVVQSGPFPPDGSAAATNRLFRNRGDGTFEDVTARSGAGDRGYGQGVVAADADGDGWTDLYVCNFGPDRLLRNRGDGTFEDRTAAAGLGAGGWSSSAAFADADGDGDLDLYVARYLDYDPQAEIECSDPRTGERRYCDPTVFEGAADLYYRNRGDGTFEDATAQAGLAGARGKGLGVVFTDLDGDGHPDVYVANDLTINFFFRNRGDGTFEDFSLLSGAGFSADGKAEAGMGIAVGDVDGDGRPELMVTNFDVETNTLYRNLGEGMFEDASLPSGFGLPSFNLLGFGIVVEDFDLDGDLDAYIANGHIFEKPGRDTVSYAQEDLLLLGDPAGRFAPARCGAAFAAAFVGRGLAAADYDNDGDADLAVSNSGGPLQLLRNEAEGAGRWLGVHLRGHPPNTEAVGARVTLVTDRRRQVRWILAGDSYQSSSERRVRFGLRPDESARALELRWPEGSLQEVPVDREGVYWEVVQGQGARILEQAPRGRTRLGALLAVAFLAGGLGQWWLRRRRSARSGPSASSPGTLARPRDGREG